MEKVIDGVTYTGETDYLSCQGCVARDNHALCDALHGGERCTINWTKKPEEQPIKVYSTTLDFIEKLGTWVTIEGDSGTFLRCTEEFREKLLKHPKVIAAYEESLVKEVKNPTSGQQGVKYDSDKTQYSLVPPYALEAVAKNLTSGLKKYKEINNWKKVPDAENRYLNALYRHLEQHRKGEIYDTDNIDPTTTHLSAIAVNAMFLLELMLNPELNGDK